MKPLSPLLFLIPLWWLANNLFVIDAHNLLHRHPPYLFIDLSLIHILLGLFLSSLSTSKPKALSLPPRALLFAGFLHAVATLATNASYRLLGAASTLVWKLAEPLPTLVLKRVFLHEHVPYTSLAGVFVVVAGVLIFSANRISISLSPVILANILFPARNIALKLAQKSLAQTPRQRYQMLNLAALPFVASAFLAKFCFMGTNVNAVPRLVGNALLFNAYQLSSICILHRLDALTHALANTLKRFTGIALSIVALHEPVQARHAVGLMYIFFGFPLYVLGDKHRSRPRISSILLAATGVVTLFYFGVMTSLEGSTDLVMPSTQQIREQQQTAGDGLMEESSAGSLQWDQVQGTIDDGMSNGEGVSLAERMEQQQETFSDGIVDDASGEDTGSESIQDVTKEDVRFKSLHSGRWERHEQEEVSNGTVRDSSSSAARMEAAQEMSERGATNKKYIVHPYRFDEYRMGQLKSVRFTSYKEALKIHGTENVGNFVWRVGSYMMLPDFTETATCNKSRYDCIQDMKRMEGGGQLIEYRAVANNFRMAGKLSGMTSDFKYEMLAQRQGVIELLVGIGSQAEFIKTTEIQEISPGKKIESRPEDFEFSSGAKQFLQEQERLGHPLMFRGDFTRDAAAANGYTSGYSTGCPSLFISTDIHLGRTLQQRYDALEKRIGDRSLKVAITIRTKPKSMEYFKRILDYYPNSYIYAQGGVDLNGLPSSGVPFERVRFFTNVEAWRESMRTMDVSVGIRIHGNMVALSVGVPVFVFAPDHRVLELAKRMRLPHMTIFDKDMGKEVDVPRIIRGRFDGDAFDKNRCEIARTYKHVFGKYGIGVGEHVSRIAEIC